MVEPVWEQRFRASSIGFPRCARDAPHRCLYPSNAGGTREWYVWDRQRDRHAQLTRSAAGVMLARISPDGGWVWWFEDTSGDESGRWMRQPFDVFDGGAVEPEPAVPELAPGFPVGLTLGRSLAAVGLSTDDDTRVYLSRRDGAPPQVLYTSTDLAWVRALSEDETLVAIEHSEHGDADYPAVRVFRIGSDGRTEADVAGELWDGPERGLSALGFAPRDRDSRLLLRHERHGRSELLIWEVGRDEGSELPIDLSGELHASWYPDGQALLVGRQRHGRSELYRYDLTSGQLTRLTTPQGVIEGCEVRPDGTVEYVSSAADRPSAPMAGPGTPLLTSSRPAPPSVPLEDAWVEGPGGSIHALVARPHTDGPAPTLFWLHGGPGGQMVDSFFPIRAAFVDAGYGVIHVNYRGSSGYGTVWRDALRDRPGLMELEDVVAVRDWAVDAGIAAATGCVITGKSWGGYLTLLALGTQPESWTAGIADVPIGDLVALYEDEMEPVRQYDRALFGGSPDELPEKWARSSPITYADRVRAPLLVIAALNDTRCPIRQVDNYLGRLDELGIAYEAYRFDAGHVSMVVDEQVRQMALQLDFCRRYVPVTEPAR